MSRPQRHSHDTEVIPLTAVRSFEERDLADEYLPSYAEVVAEERTRPSERPPSFSDRPEPESQISSPQVATRRKNPFKANGKLLKMYPCLLTPLLCFVIGAIFSGVEYCKSFANPTPPTAANDAGQYNYEIFMIWMIFWGLCAYPFLFCFLIIVFPRLFALPKDAIRSPESRQAWRAAHRTTPVRNKCCGIYCGLTLTYFAIVALAIWGVIKLANTELQRTVELFSAQDWVGNYVVVEKTFNGTTASFFSPGGQRLGAVVFSESSDLSWSMAIEPPAMGIEQIFYTNQSEVALTPITFNATCAGPQHNHTETDCLSGGVLGLVIPYVSNPQSKYPKPEFFGDLNITISAFDPHGTLNISSNPANVASTNSEYQGIGGNYPPLGSWYYNNSQVLQVLWNTSGNRACEGLRINLSNAYEGMAWSMLGIIWGWWKQWGEKGDCSWE